MSVFGVILVRIFPHSDWIRRETPYLVQMRENADQNNSEYGYFLHITISTPSEKKGSLSVSDVLTRYKMRHWLGVRLRFRKLNLPKEFSEDFSGQYTTWLITIKMIIYPKLVNWRVFSRTNFHQLLHDGGPLVRAWTL